MKQFVLLSLWQSTLPMWARADDVDAYIERSVREHNIPGASVAVVRDGKLLKGKGYGLADVELDAPATPETVYQLASMTKPFTAIGVMLLVEGGRVRLDGRVSECHERDPFLRRLGDGPARRWQLTNAPSG